MPDTQEPYKGTSEVRLVDLINEANGTELKLTDDFTFGAISDYTDAQGRNTKIVLKANASTSFADDVVFYNRLPITVLTNLPDIDERIVRIESLPTSVHELLDDINETLGLDLTTDEVLNTTITEKESTYPLTIVDGSVAWLPSTYNFNVHHAEDDEPPEEDPPV